jgi:hypothetical protein
MRHLLAATAAFVLAGCGTMQFTPTEYPLRDGLIPPFPVAGDVTVTNNQPSKTQTIVYSASGSHLATNLNTVTEVMTGQTRGELAEAGQKSGAGTAKTIALKVNVLLSTYVMFSTKSHIDFDVQLGDGQVLKFDVHHASGSLAQDLNGCIAEGVMTMLNDARVKAYLAAP